MELIQRRLSEASSEFFQNDNIKQRGLWKGTMEGKGTQADRTT